MCRDLGVSLTAEQPCELPGRWSTPPLFIEHMLCVSHASGWRQGHCLPRFPVCWRGTRERFLSIVRVTVLGWGTARRDHLTLSIWEESRPVTEEVTLTLDLKGQAGFPGWGRRRGKGLESRRDSQAGGWREGAPESGSTQGERGHLVRPPPRCCPLPMRSPGCQVRGSAGLWDLRYHHTCNIVMGSVLFIYFSFEIILDL